MSNLFPPIETSPKKFNEMQQVLSGLWIGGTVASRNFNMLKINKISHILSMNGAVPWLKDMISSNVKLKINQHKNSKRVRKIQKKKKGIRLQNH